MEQPKSRINSFMLDIKAMGGIFAAPIIIMLVGSLYVWMVYRGYPADSLMVHIRGSFGIFSFPFICMWIFGLFQDIVESDGKESLLSLPYRAPIFGIVRVLRMTALYIALFFVVFLGLVTIMFQGELPLEAADIFLPFLSLLFFSGFSYFIIILTKSSLISYTVFCVYCIFQYMTRGAFSASVYPFHWSFPKPYTNTYLIASLLLLFACVFYIVGQYFFSKREYLLK